MRRQQPEVTLTAAPHSRPRWRDSDDADWGRDRRATRDGGDPVPLDKVFR